MTDNILITGASGFIGRHLLSKLEKEKNYALRVAVRQKHQDSFASTIEKYLVDDINADTDWKSALSGCHVVIHTAARVHVMDETAKDPLAEFRRVNTEGTLHLARQASCHGVKRFIFISSIKVNGEETTINSSFKADDVVCPLDPYAMSKHEAEEGLLKIAAETGLEVVIIRPPLVYGPGVKGNFQRMLQWLKRGIPLPLGAVKNKRSFVYVDNLTDLIACCIEHPQAAGQVFLVSDGEDLSTTELLRKMGEALGKSPRLLPVPCSLLTMAATLVGKKAVAQRLFGSLRVDISKTQKRLNWQPMIKSGDALRETAIENTDK